MNTLGFTGTVSLSRIVCCWYSSPELSSPAWSVLSRQFLRRRQRRSPFLSNPGIAWAIFVAVLIAGLAVWLARAGKDRRLRQLGWIVLSIFVVEGLLGMALGSPSPLSDILHALIGPISFASAASINVFTSERWKRGPNFVEDSWRPPLRKLAFFLPAIVTLQIVLGAAFRYRAASVIWHILNAMIVLLSILIVCVFLVRQFPEHPSLRPAAIALGGITAVQVFLGFTTFVMLLLFPESSPAVIIVSVVHVATGALTLAATVSLAAEIRRNVVEVRSLTGQ